MTYTFRALAAGAEIDPDGYFTEAGISKGADGGGFVMLFMSSEEEPDEQDIGLGFDMHWLVTAGQGTAYGCVPELT